MAAAQHGVVDELDLRILGALIDDPQASIKDVALTLGVPASTCAFRLRTLRSRGLPGWRIAVHLLRNSAPASLTILALMFVGLLSGAIIVEQVFGIKGIGELTQTSAQNGDIPMLMGVTVVTVIFVVIVNLLLDIVLGWINPKVRVK